MIIVIRISLSCILLWFVYHETGTATTLALTLVMLAIEAQTLSLNVGFSKTRRNIGYRE